MEGKKKAYIVAVGGVGMSALAGLFRKAGWEVSGSDRAVYPPVSDYLREMGVRVLTPYHEKNVPEGWSVYVVGNAVTSDNPEAVRIREMGVDFHSLPSALSEYFLKGKKRIVVAGTHGKTTTTAMTAFSLEKLGFSPSYFIGGIPVDLGSSSGLGEGHLFVLEGDEYDSAYFDKRPKFMHYEPDILALTSLEFDHADIYDSLEDVRFAFGELLKSMRSESTLVAVLDYPEIVEILNLARCRVVTLSRRVGADARLKVLREGPGEVAGVLAVGEREYEIRLGIPGAHNLMNAAVASLILEAAGVPIESALSVLKDFRGVKRRQTYLGTAGGVVVVDDFAHHPTAVVETIRGVRSFYKPKRLIAVFEPRSNTSRRNVFEEEYAQALSEADAALIAPPFSAEKIPESERFAPERVADMIRSAGKTAVAFDEREEVPRFLYGFAREGDLLLFMSNGDFGGVQIKTLRLLENKEGNGND